MSTDRRSMKQKADGRRAKEQRAGRQKRGALPRAHSAFTPPTAPRLFPSPPLAFISHLVTLPSDAAVASRIEALKVPFA